MFLLHLNQINESSIEKLVSFWILSTKKNTLIIIQIMLSDLILFFLVKFSVLHEKINVERISNIDSSNSKRKE